MRHCQMRVGLALEPWPHHVIEFYGCWWPSIFHMWLNNVATQYEAVSSQKQRGC